MDCDFHFTITPGPGLGSKQLPVWKVEQVLTVTRWGMKLTFITLQYGKGKT